LYIVSYIFGIAIWALLQ